jgi:type VI secretion system protein
VENISLYDLLVGCFIFRGDDPGEVDVSYFDSMTEEEKLRQSIVENLKMILQSRRGSVEHLPDFGLPDIRQIYFDEGSIDSVPNLIRDTILKYEPRLEEVKVKRKNFDANNLRLSLEIYAKIKQLPGKEVLLTEFSSTGWLKVVFERDLQKQAKQEEAE